MSAEIGNTPMFLFFNTFHNAMDLGNLGSYCQTIQEITFIDWKITSISKLWVHKSDDLVFLDYQEHSDCSQNGSFQPFFASSWCIPLLMTDSRKHIWKSVFLDVWISIIHDTVCASRDRRDAIYVSRSLWRTELGGWRRGWRRSNWGKLAASWKGTFAEKPQSMMLDPLVPWSHP